MILSLFGLAIGKIHPTFLEIIAEHDECACSLQGPTDDLSGASYTMRDREEVLLAGKELAWRGTDDLV